MSTVYAIELNSLQTVRSYSSTLEQARDLILSMYLHLILIYKIYEVRHAAMILRICREHSKVDSVNSISQLWIMLGSQDLAVSYI